MIRSTPLPFQPTLTSKEDRASRKLGGRSSCNLPVCRLGFRARAPVWTPLSSVGSEVGEVDQTFIGDELL